MKHFESEGLFVGLVSYPFYVDGKDLFKDIFSRFFENHCNDYLKRLTSASDLEDNLYKPTAYRMLGKFGLAVVSLIDDYAFCSRIFNAGHIRVNGESKYKSVVIAGSSDSEENGHSYLVERAKSTFLIKENRFPFIAIIRLKIDYRLLLGYGCKVTNELKYLVEYYRNALLRNGCSFESFVVDCYDNDELLVVAFSNSLDTLYSFMSRVRETDVEQFDSQRFRGYSKKWEGKKHVFSACHMSYGYHIDFDFEGSNSGFINWDNRGIDDFNVNCLIETKPGHRDYLCDYLNNNGAHLYGNRLELSRTATGGSLVHFRIPVDKISTLHNEARANDIFKCHIRRVKLTLNYRKTVKPVKEEILFHGSEPELINYQDINDIRDSLARIGVSKIVRDRLLAMLDLYGDCSRNKLQTYYFEQMQPAVRNIQFILQGLENRKSEPLWEVENLLNEEISAFETAFYNRMNNKMTPNAILEYSGGIQQFLQAFGYAYKALVSICAPQEAGKQYSLITGLSKEFSVRTHTELNINHIIYPQLFATTSWKEASNFSMQVIGSELDSFTFSNLRDQKMRQSFLSFSEFISEEKSFGHIKNLLFQQTDLAPSNNVYLTINSLINRSLLKYMLSDYLVYHFAFQRNFELMWYHYFKTFLQTTSNYYCRGVVSMKNLVFLFLRLFFVAEIEKDKVRKSAMIAWIKTHSEKPFDYLLSGLWFSCYDVSLIAAKNIVSNLDSYGLIEVCEQLVLGAEYVLLDEKRYPHFHAEYLYRAVSLLKSYDRGITINCILDERLKNVIKLQNAIEEGTLSIDSFECNNPSSPDNVICLLSSFLFAASHLGDMDAKVKSLPRLEDGGIDFLTLEQNPQWFDPILSDPAGGFIIPDHQVRKKYFKIRTALYRVLWDLSYHSKLFSKQ